MLRNHPIFRAVDRLICGSSEVSSIKIIALIRLTPVPYSIVSYLIGLTSIKFKDFFLGSFAVICHVFLQIYIGHSINRVTKGAKASDNESNENHQEYLLLGVELIVTFLIGFFVSYKGKALLDKEFLKFAEEEEQEKIEGLELRNFDGNK